MVWKWKIQIDCNHLQHTFEVCLFSCFTYRVSRRSNVGGTHANLLKFNNWLKMVAIIGFNGDSGGRTSLHKISMHSSTPSCSGVSSESDIVDIMYGVESLCTGTATAFISTVLKCCKSSSVNLNPAKVRENSFETKDQFLLTCAQDSPVLNMLKQCRKDLNQCRQICLTWNENIHIIFVIRQAGGWWFCALDTNV